MADWAELHQDLLAFIAKRIGLLEDFISFARVCKSWCSVAVKRNFNGSRQTPWLMLAGEEEEEAENLITSDYRRFISITNGELIGRIMLPEAKGKRCLESLGWFVTISETGDMSLLNPMSRVQISLPHITTFKNYVEGLPTIFNIVQKAVLSSVPSPSSKDYALMVIYEGCLYPGAILWARRWGKDFCLRRLGSNPTKAREVGQIGAPKFIGPKQLYIVESQGELLIVVRDGCDISFADEKDHESFMKGSLEETLYNFDEPRIHYGVQEFRVFKVDLLSDGWTSELIQSLGDNALFLGDSSSISIEASKFPGIRPNCIYYTDDNWEAYIYSKQGGGKDTGIYNLEDRSRTAFYQGVSRSRVCPPLWVSPSF
ncbi:F-box protein SKIP23-like [Rhododendron vialii]|uniref:F-box protein SKIP23-like n=1 Tax=Rhododendron vialii TaxID=182163 RepID=UPI00265DD4F4|nr:F-box protein SKIP23-like [Rhododendron vialii]